MPWIARFLLALILSLAVVAASEASTSAAQPPSATTSSGVLHGLDTGVTHEFLGVRYATAGRWDPPVLEHSGSRAVDATRPGAICPQTGDLSLTEDCLFLNVTTPRTAAPGADLPVMFWIYGGGYVSGSAATYDAQRLASRGNVIVITANYRLGIFGFLGLPGLPGAGDFGLLDVVAALRWTKLNAAAFGGNPQNVTVFGQSSGAAESCALLTSPAARGLMEKVISQSGGSCNLNWPRGGLEYNLGPGTTYASLATDETVSRSVAGQLGCAQAHMLSCLRALPAAALTTHTLAFSNRLAYDTPLLPHNPAQAVRQGRTLRIPVLSGGTQDEEAYFVSRAATATPTAYTPTSYPRLLSNAFGSHAAQVGAQYPLSHFPSAAAAFAQVITDDSWACATLAADRALIQHGVPVWAYEFSDGAQSGHASDLPYVFDLNGRNALSTPTEQNESNAIIDYWASFARTGRPSVPLIDPWRPFTAGGVVHALYPSAITNVNAAAEHHCGLWARVNPNDR